MSGYGQFCPIAQAMEVIGERWTLLVVRELLCGSSRFSELQRGVPLMSRSVLAQRLKTLMDAGIVARSGGGYVLTAAGEELRGIVMAFGAWGRRWVHQRITSSNVDVGLLMWDIQRRIDIAAIPAEHVLVELELRGAPRGKGRFWLHLKGDEVELCLTPPHRKVTLHVYTTPKALAEIWIGEVPFERAARAGDIRVEGPRALVRAFPSWLRLSMFAGVERPAAPPNGRAPEARGARL